MMESHLFIHESSAPSTTPLSHSITNFPIIAIAVIGILAAAFLLVSYYIIVIKCCINLHRVSVTQDSEMMHSPARMQQQPKGLDQAAINSIPIVEFNKAQKAVTFQECSVCLGEFKVNEKLRCLQDCSHLFHMDCIDVWLQSNSNCPVCRTSISYTNPSTTQDLTTAETATHVESNFVVIEIQQQQEAPANHCQRDTPRRMMWQQVLSMGDEWIDVRVKDDAFKIQPIRRSISMDDQQLHLMVQDVLLLHHHHQKIVSDQACSSSSSRLKRAFFSHLGSSGRGCKGSHV